MNGSVVQRWDGDYYFVLRTLLMKDFRVRYRNMSLGVGWSLANPLVMMTVYWFVFTKIYPSQQQNFPIFLLCGLIPFNFFTLAWLTATTSMVDNANLIKRTRFPREIVPISAVLGIVLHFAIQLGLLLSLVLIFGDGFNRHWVWLPLLVVMEVMFAVGVGLAFSALDVYIRDIRYLVESANLILFFLVPVFYSFESIPKEYIIMYRLNPVAAVVFAFRNVLLENRSPSVSLLLNLAMVSGLSLVGGALLFERLKRRFYDYL
ncbi:MAG: hypothetical protein IANPNBLG_00700 [Bryobacteraceae bacterium]|nr:hypothetical protein [Bryobacteraceae bacterium]